MIVRGGFFLPVIGDFVTNAGFPFRTFYLLSGNSHFALCLSLSHSSPPCYSQHMGLPLRYRVRRRGRRARIGR